MRCDRKNPILARPMAFVAAASLLWISAAYAEPTTKPDDASSLTTVKLSQTTEDGKKLLVATVTSNGKPVEDVPVAFHVQRAFGELKLGTEKTLDDGTAAVPFPSDLPGGTKGELNITAEISPNAKVSLASASTVFPGIVSAFAPPAPRALSGSRAPIGLILIIGIIMGSVWSSFGYVAYQIVLIKKGSSR